jgi:hypothetical protein
VVDQRADRGARAAAGGERAENADGGEERGDCAGGEAPAKADTGAVARGLVVAFDNLHVARLVLGHHGGVPVQRRPDVLVGDVDVLVGSQRVLDAVVGGGQHISRVAHAASIAPVRVVRITLLG